MTAKKTTKKHIRLACHTISVDDIKKKSPTVNFPHVLTWWQFDQWLPFVLIFGVEVFQERRSVTMRYNHIVDLAARPERPGPTAWNTAN